MSSDLFRAIVDVRPSTPSSRFSGLPLSLFVHVLVLLALIVIPLLATDVLPLVRGGEMEWALPVVAVPAQPPAAPPASPQRASAPAVNPDAAPTEAPTGVQPERLVPTPPSADFVAQRDVVPGPEFQPGQTVITAEPPPPAPTAPVPAHLLVRAPVKIHDVAPSYPEMARAAHVQGVVIVEAIIGPTGDVVEARTLRSVALLDEAALAAVRQWKYTPTLLRGVPVPVIMTVTVRFTLQ